MQDTIDRCLGWVTQFNPLSVAKGALSRAENVRIGRENLIESRRGSAVYTTLSANLARLLVYSDRVLAQRGTTIEYDNGSGTFASYSGSYSAPSGAKIRGIEARSNFLFTTSAGVKVFTDVAGTAARSAGLPRALDPSYSLTGASGFLANSYQCAYRVVFERTDANANVIVGYPSQRLWVVNGAGAGRNVILTNYIPSEILAGDVMLVYRADQVSGTATDTSGDEMGLVYRYALTSADITAGFVAFTDSVVDDLIGETLYTSPSQQGIAQANDRPPVCKDIALYKSDYAFFANCSTRQRLLFSLVGTSGLSSRTITLAGVTYNFGASEIVSGGGSPQALVSASGTAAVAIDETARSLVRVINRYAGNTSIYAYYLSGPDQLPGQIMIEERSLGGAAFTIQAGDSTISPMFFPAPPTSGTTTASTSSNSVQRNALYFCKAQQPEHVPATNYVFAGAANKDILRIASLKDSVIVIKEDGVFQVTGDSPQNFSVQDLDLTVKCKSAGSVVVLANQVLMLSNQGVVSISDTGVAVVSRDIEDQILPLLAFSSLDDYTVGVAYESDRTYLLSTMSSSTDTGPTQTFVYNVFTKAWSKDTYGIIDGIVEPSVDRLFMAKSADAKVYRERKDFQNTDYADPEHSITITEIDGDEITFSVSGATPQSGWVIEQGGVGLPIDTVFTGVSDYTATLIGEAPVGWTTGAATLIPNVDENVEYAPWTGGSSQSLKQARAVQFINNPIDGSTNVSQLIGTFRTSFDAETEEVEIDSQASGWGDAWGEIPWGGAQAGGFPTWVPLNKQYFQWIILGFRHRRAQEKISLAATGITFEVASDLGGGR